MASPLPSSSIPDPRAASPTAAATKTTDEAAAAAAAAVAAASPVLDDGRDSPDLPLTMTASTVLLSLPRDAAAALAAAGGFPQEKVVLRFKPVGSAPSPARPLVKVASTQKFDSVVAYLRRMLRVGETESLFLYVNHTFAPALEEVVGNLWRCFKDSNNQLNISYSITPAFG